jgi:hypothetical protein
MSARPGLCGGYHAEWYPYRDHQFPVNVKVRFLRRLPVGYCNAQEGDTRV